MPRASSSSNVHLPVPHRGCGLNVASLTRGRLVDAMGLGPLWVRRGTAVDDGSTGRAELIAAAAWEPLREMVGGCLACRLSGTRTHAVFGDGAERPEWLIVGGGPGADDDAAGEPFVGPAGRLLDGILSAVGLSRGRDVFVTHAVKCRAPDDRAPTGVEAACCRPYLERQVALLGPKLVIAVGDRATGALLGSDAKVDTLRGRPHVLRTSAGDIALVVTDDPVDLLRDGAGKARVWADLCLARVTYERLAAAG